MKIRLLIVVIFLMGTFYGPFELSRLILWYSTPRWEVDAYKVIGIVHAGGVELGGMWIAYLCAVALVWILSGYACKEVK